MTEEFRYWAFISYSHQDRAWGDWLHKGLETYRVPRRLVGRSSPDGVIPRRLFPVFRDRDELPSSADLGSVINSALRQSRYLIVICSPQSASSRWVDEEIKYFKSLGRADRVLCVIVGGEPWASDKPDSGLVECFAPGLRYVVGADGELAERRAEPVAADARGGKDGRSRARLKLIAGMLGLSFDELRQRERQRLFWQRATAAVAGVVLAVAAAAGWHWQQTERQQALDAQALKTRLAHFYETGRRELLDHHEARAAVYLNAVYSAGIDTPALRFMLARAMRSVDAESLRIQTGSSVLLSAISPEGKRLLTVGADFWMRAWDSSDGRKLWERKLEIEKARAPSFSVEFSRAAGNVVVVDIRATELRRRQLEILDAASGRIVAAMDADPDVLNGTVPYPLDPDDQRLTFVAPDKSVVVRSLEGANSLRIQGRYAVSQFCKDSRAVILGAENGDVDLVDSVTGELRKRFTGLAGPVSAVDSDQACQSVAAATPQGSARIWSVENGEVLMSGGHEGALAAINLSQDGSRLVTRALKNASIWNGRTGTLIFSRDYTNPLESRMVASDDMRLVASEDGISLSMIDSESSSVLYSLDGHEGGAQTFAFSSDKTWFVSGGLDGSVVLWRLPNRFIAKIPQDKGGSVVSNAQDDAAVPVAFSHDSKLVVVGGRDGSSSLFGEGSPTPKVAFRVHASAVSAVALNGDDTVLATGSFDHLIRIWDVASGQLVKELKDSGGRIWSLGFDRNSRMLSAAIDGGRVELWDARTWTPIASFERDHAAASAIAPDGKSLVVGIHGWVKLWDTAKRSFLWSASPLESHVEDADAAIGLTVFDSEGRQLLVSRESTDAYILDAGSGKTLHHLAVPNSAAFWDARFNSRGDTLIFGDGNGTGTLWQPKTGRVLTLHGHTAEVTVVDFSPNGALALTAGKDGAEKIWDAETGDLLDTELTHDGEIGWNSAKFSPDGQRLLSGGTDHFAVLRDVHLENRKPAEIGRLLACRVAWQITDEMLESSVPKSDACLPQTAAAKDY